MPHNSFPFREPVFVGQSLWCSNSSFAHCPLDLKGLWTFRDGKGYSVCIPKKINVNQSVKLTGHSETS